LSISRTITVIWQNPAERKVVRGIPVNHCARRKLVVIFFTVKRLFDAAVVFMAFFISLAIFKQNAACVLLPVIPVVCIQMTFIKSEFRQQDRVTRQLIKITEQGCRFFINHKKYIEITGFMG